MSIMMLRRMRERNLVDVNARVGATSDEPKSNGLVTAMLATLGVILFLGLFAAGDAASGRHDL